MIEVKNLVKRYGDHAAVDDLSFRIEKGKVYGFLGPNGAGKSTTMNMITGYIASTEGSISINGHDILEEPEEAKKCIGYLPELPPLYQEMTVLEYLKFVADLKKIKKEQKKEMLEEIMDSVKITEMKNRLIRNLSKGYKQRVGLAQALIGYPEIIILDEPTVGLDPKQIIEIRELISSLKEKHTIILSSHILSEVSAICDYILIISHGKLVASDTTENLSSLSERTSEIEMLVRGEREEIGQAIQELEGIVSFKLEYDEEQNANKICISTSGEDDIDIRETIFYKMAEKKFPIIEMKSVKASLEEVFLELTENEQKEAAEQLNEDMEGEENNDSSL